MACWIVSASLRLWFGLTLLVMECRRWCSVVEDRVSVSDWESVSMVSIVERGGAIGAIGLGVGKRGDGDGHVEWQAWRVGTRERICNKSRYYKCLEISFCFFADGLRAAQQPDASPVPPLLLHLTSSPPDLHHTSSPTPPYHPERTPLSHLLFVVLCSVCYSP